MNTFRVKYMDAIVQRIIAWVAGTSQKQTDFTVGSRIRTLIEAFAQEIEELNNQLYTGLKESALGALFDGFQFPAKAASKAMGSVTFSRATAASQGYVIPAGTIVATRGSSADASLRFLTIAAVTLAQGETYVTATVRAENAGPDYNVLADTITYIVSAVQGVEAVTNPAGFTNGQEAEPDSKRAERFRLYVNSLQRGTETAIVRAIEDNVDGVAGVAVVESPNLYCFQAGGSGPTFVDYSTEANLPGGTAFSAFPASPAIGDCLYIGASRRFNSLYVGLRQVANGVPGAWQYWDGSAWNAIPNVVDNAGAFSASDTVEWTWSDVASWRTCVVNGQKAYWIRYRLSVATITTMPTVSYLWASPPPGNVLIYAHDGAGTLSTETKTAIESVVARYRAAGVKAAVLEPSILTVPVTVSLELAQGADRASVTAAVAAAINSYFANLKVGQRVPREELSQLVMNVDDDGIIDCGWTSPTGDVDVSPEQLARLGTLTVN